MNPLAQPSTPPRPKAKTPRGHILLFVALGVAATGMAIQGFRLLQVSQVHISDQLLKATETGRTVDREGCVDHVMKWYGQCAAMKSLCEASVGRVMEACLVARSRASECVALGDSTRHTQFGFKECQARGVDRWNKKACASAYRAIDRHCSRRDEG
jgi:hypothetical protein